jgi:hypothetical protein
MVGYLSCRCHSRLSDRHPRKRGLAMLKGTGVSAGQIVSAGGVTLASLAAGASQTTVASPGIALTTATPANVTSKSLAAGTYLVWGAIDFALTGASTTEFRGGISVVSATLPTQPGGGGIGPDALSVLPLVTTLLSDVLTDSAGPTIVTLAATTTLFLVAQSTFSAGSMTAFGTLSALLI